MTRKTRPEDGLARRQHGVVSRAQLLAAGLSDDAVDHRVRIASLHRVHRGVYAVGDPRLTQEGRWMAAVLACGAGAVLSHRSAGALWRIRVWSVQRADISVPSRSGREKRYGIAIHRPSTLTDADCTTRWGIPVTTPARTLIDLATELTPRQLERALDEATVLNLIDPQTLRASLDAAVPHGQGAARLRSALTTHDPGSTLTRSELEERFLKLCDDHGLPRPLVNETIEGFEVDFAWPERRLIVETDGFDYHRTQAAVERDRERELRLRAAGWEVRRLTYRQVVAEQALVAADLRRPRRA